MSRCRPANDQTPSGLPGRRARLAAGLAVTALVFLSGLGSVARGVGEPEPSGNPFRGREIFGEKGCGRCHSIWGHGGSLGPDISVAVVGKTWYELVGDFWNHTPRMIDEVGERGYEWPTLTPAEMSDTLSYLYYLRLFDEPGDPVRGAAAYDRLQCSACHTLGGRGGPGGGPLDRFGVYPSPAPLAQAMWNAGPRMQKAQLRRGSPIPQFTGHELADLQAHIRSEGLRRGREVELQPLPDPVRGAEVFHQKRCDACHGGRGRQVPDVTRSALSKTVSEITGLLWNHSYAMGAEMTARGVPFPRFEKNEMSDLIAHLFFLGYIGEDGDPKRGARVFEAKACADCHSGRVEGVPDLPTVLRTTHRAHLAAAMWNHAPQMHELMAETSQFWPRFEPSEMRDLVAYLRSLTRDVNKHDRP